MSFLDQQSIRRIKRERIFIIIGFAFMMLAAILVYALLPVWLGPFVLIVWVPVFYALWFGGLGNYVR